MVLHGRGRGWLTCSVSGYHLTLNVVYSALAVSATFRAVLMSLKVKGIIRVRIWGPACAGQRACLEGGRIVLGTHAPHACAHSLQVALCLLQLMAGAAQDLTGCEGRLALGGGRRGRVRSCGICNSAGVGHGLRVGSTAREGGEAPLPRARACGGACPRGACAVRTWLVSQLICMPVKLNWVGPGTHGVVADMVPKLWMRQPMRHRTE